MCAPLAILAVAGAAYAGGTAAAVAVGSLALASSMRKRGGSSAPAAGPDPGTERAAAEAKAAQDANARLATDQRRRREQGSLIAKGSPAFTLGDPTTTTTGQGLSPISSSTTSGSGFVSRGSPSSAPLITMGGGGGSSGRSTRMYS